MTKSRIILIQFCRYLLAVVFIFSGFVKGVDPLGSAYKFTDYFKAFNLDFLENLSLAFSFILCAAELLIGLLLLFGIRPRLAAWGAFLFMVVFTPLTFVLAVFNPVSDCGCFGDALKLSNWETFFKNIFFLAAALILLLGRTSLKCNLKKLYERIAFPLLIIISLLPSWYGYNHLPLINFRPYKIGVNIPDAMKIPENAPVDEYKTTFYYEKDGEIKEFNESNYPWQDSTWKYVDSKSVVVKKGFSPAIDNFHILSIDGSEITDSIIYHKGYYFLFVSRDISKIHQHESKYINQLYLLAKEKGYGFSLVTSSGKADIDNYISRDNVLFPFTSADEVLLKTMIRANPGLILLKDGTIIGKWHSNDFPDIQIFQENPLSYQLLALNSDAVRMEIYLIISIILFLLALVWITPQLKK